MLGRVTGDSKETQTFVSTWDAWLPWSLAWHPALPSACQPDADDMAARTALRAEQWESDDAFLPSAHSRQSEANRNHSRAVGLYFKELSTAFLDTFCERTEQSLYLAQWLLIKTESYGGGKNSDTSPSPASPDLLPPPPRHSPGSGTSWLT